MAERMPQTYENHVRFVPAYHLGAFGILVIKSRFFPRILGILLMVAGSAYVISSVTSITLPAHRQVVSRILMPLYFGEVPIILWLLIMGAKTPQPRVRPSQVS